MIKERFSENLKGMLHEDRWMILQDAYDPEDTLKYESLFCLSNGYLGTRGCFEEGTKKSIPCTYINGVFDKSEAFMRELANLPNWLGFKLYVEKELIGVEDCEILEFSRVLDMKNAILVKRVVLRDKKGRETQVEGLRLISRSHVHWMAIRLFVTPLNYDGIIEIESITDGTVINFCDAPRFKVIHTVLKENKSLDENGAYMEVATRDSGLHVGIGSYIDGTRAGENVINNHAFHAFGEQAIEFWDFKAEKGVTTELTKYVSIYTERDVAKEALFENVEKELKAFGLQGLEKELSEHQEIYDRMWQQADITIDGDSDLERAIRFNIFHLMSTGNEHDDRVNVGAKLLHGEEYGGHAFWDTELFMLPFFAWNFPKTASNLENYRYRLLDAAKANAKKNGYQGAQYPWESADDGTEQCPDWTIEPDGSCYRCYVAVYEHHVTAAVAYGIYNYVKITGDWTFMEEKGLELLVETARFWSSRCEYNEKEDRYEIRQVTGPDEWHEPVDNNLYTNYLAKWNLEYVLSLLSEMKAAERMGVTKEELLEWKERAEKLYLPHKEGTRLLEQFEGYFDLKEVLIERYDKNDWPIRPEALKAHPIPETQIIKQADVVMLLHLMGDSFDEETKKENYAFYEKRTLHGSSLSPSIYSIMGLRVGDASKAYRYLRRAAFLDLLNLQKNTREGIHAANAGGVWQTVVFGFAGVEIESDGVLAIRPKLPEEWNGLKFRLWYQNSLIEVEITGQNKVKTALLQGEEIKIRTEKGERDE
ncbi:MAG: glycoside hydrolase family 65 protein [Acetivibrio ethanolgignens]